MTRSTDTIKFMLQPLLAALFLIAAGWSAPVWENGANGELRWGDSLKIDSYELVVADFSNEETDDERVLLDVYDDGDLITSRALLAGEDFAYNDSLRVVVDEISMGDPDKEPFAKVRMQPVAAPEIEMKLVSNDDIFEGGDEIELELNVKNTAAVDASNLKIHVESVPPFLNADCSISELKPGRTWDEDRRTAAIEPIVIKLKAPFLPGPEKVTVRAVADYIDPQKRHYQSRAGTAFLISGPLLIRKEVEELQEYGKGYFVVITLRNIGNRTLDLDVTDSPGQHFKADSALKREIEILPGSTELMSYKIEAKKPGLGLEIPPAQASYSLGGKRYTAKSESPLVDVFGPYVEAERTVQPSRVKEGEEVKISASLYNSGNKKSLVKLEQPIPAGIKLVEGELNGSYLLAPEEKRSVEMILKCLGPDDITMPPAAVEYRDVRGRAFLAKLSSLSIRIEKEAPPGNINETVVEAEDPEAENNTEREAADVDVSDEGHNRNLAAIVLLFLGLIYAVFSRYA